MLPDWLDFKAPDYDRLFKVRCERLLRAREGELWPSLIDYYRENPVDFITDWGMTFDPRNAEIKQPTVVPFALFQKQQDFVTWVVDRWRSREDGLGEKSRDMGISWLCVGIAVWMWRFHPGVVVGFGSRKEEYVDKIGDPKCLFWKVRFFIRMLPIELRPVGYIEREHAPHMRVLNPENGSSIVGEAGDNIGRGARTSIYFKDESAFYEHAEAIEAALSQTSNCKIDISTVNGNGNVFYRKRHSGKIKVFTFHWRDDPRKGEAWYQKQVDVLDAVIVAQEIDIDYNASTSDAWISGKLMEDAQRIGPADVVAMGQWVVSVDAAHFGDDQSVIHRRRGRLNLPQIKRKKMDGVQLAGLVTEECRKLESDGNRVRMIVIELDGPGVSCYDTMMQGPYADRMVGVHTGARLDDGKNFNLRAFLWRSAQEYLTDGPVSIANEPDLKATLCSLKFKYKDGLLLMQSKKEYKALFGRSPDEADAFVLGFAPMPVEKPKPMNRNHTARDWRS